MSLSPFLTPFFLFIQTPCHSPPLTSRAKDKNQQIKTNTLTPFSPHVEEAFCRSDIYKSDQAPPQFMLNVQNIFSNQVHDSMTFLSPMTHTYIKYPSNWIYIWDSSTQPSGFTHFNSATQPSGFTKFVKSLHDWKLQFYIMGLNMTFSSRYKYDHL